MTEGGKFGKGARNATVAVCIPSYNYGRFIDRCLESVVAQTYRNLEIIVSDDCSTDDSDRVIRQFKDVRIRYVRQEHRLGMTGNWRACVAESQAPYMVLLGADDYLKPTMVEECVKVLEEHPDMAFCHTAVELFTDSGEIIGDTGAFTASYVKPGLDVIEDFIGGKQVCISAAVFRRTCFEEIGGWRDKYRNCMDADLWFRMLLKWKVGYIGRILAGFRVHDVSDEWKMMQIEEDLCFTQEMFDSLPPSLARVRRLRRAVETDLRSQLALRLATLPPSAERDALQARLIGVETPLVAGGGATVTARPAVSPVGATDPISQARRSLKGKTRRALLRLPDGMRYLLGSFADIWRRGRLRLRSVFLADR